MPTPARRPLPGVARRHFPGRGLRIHPGLGFIGSEVHHGGTETRRGVIGTAGNVNTIATRTAGFPLVRFTAGSKLTPGLVGQKLIAEYRAGDGVI